MKELKRGKGLDYLETFDVAIIVNNQKTLDQFQDKTGLYNKPEFNNIEADTCFTIYNRDGERKVKRMTIQESKETGYSLLTYYQAFEIKTSPAMATKRKPNVKGHGYWG